MLDAGTDASVDAGQPDAGAPDAGFPVVDRTNPKLYEVRFTARDADPDAGVALGTEQAFLDTRATPRGLLVIHLHGAGTQTTCGSAEHGRLLARWGFHVFMPCYVSDYGVGNCGADIGGCRLEAFDGTDRTSVIAIARPDSIEQRVIRALQRLATTNPQGDWSWYLDHGVPRWDHIVISGISHGASTSGLISKVKAVHGAVMLSGPLDTDQAWLSLPTATSVEHVYGFTHTADPQHPGHLAAFTTMQLPGVPISIDAGVPYQHSHRLVTSIPASDGHSSTEANGASPKDGGAYVYEPVWHTMYEVP